MTEDDEVELVENTYAQWLAYNPTAIEVPIHQMAQWAFDQGLITDAQYTALLEMPNEFAL